MIAPPGGVMTAEAGAITGDLVLAVEPVAEGRLQVLVSYAGAAEWYRVSGGPVSAGADPARIFAWLVRDPGHDPDGNPRPTSLEDLPDS